MTRHILFIFLAVATTVFTQSKITEDPKYLCLLKIADSTRKGSQNALSGIEDAHSLVLFYKGLSKEVRNKIDKCELNLAPATKRCERVHGKGNCVKITPTFVNRKCTDGFRIEGCCQCVVDCPKKWEDRGYWCMKPEVSTLKQFKTKDECSKEGKKCTQWGKAFWVQECPAMHERIGGALCVPRCPHGWNDQGPRCQKPRNHHIGHPFIWAHGDK